MKTLILAATLITSSLSWATDIAHYRFAVRDQINNEVVHVEVTLNDGQELKLVSSIFTGRGPIFFPGPARETREITTRLGNLTYADLMQRIQYLSNVELEKRTQTIVCMMIPSPEMSNDHLTVRRDFDYETQDFLGEMEIVSGPQGCWVRNIVQPKTPYMAGFAKETKAALKLLALNIIE